MNEYRVHLQLRRRSQPPFDNLTVVTEDFEDDETFCLAIASKLMELLKEDREFLETVEE